MANDNFLIKNLKANPLAWVTTSFSLVLLSLNVWMTFRLIPVEKSLDKTNTHIEAIETRNKELDPLVERFYKVEEKQKSLEIQTASDIKEIKDTLVRFEGKLDNLHWGE